MFEAVGDDGEAKGICNVILRLCLELCNECAVRGCDRWGAMGCWFAELSLIDCKLCMCS